MMCLWCAYDVFMICLWWYAYDDMPMMLCLWCAYDVSMICLWCAYDVPMICLWRYAYDKGTLLQPMICLWCDYDVPMICLWWYAYDISTFLQPTVSWASFLSLYLETSSSCFRTSHMWLLLFITGAVSVSVVSDLPRALVHHLHTWVLSILPQATGEWANLVAICLTYTPEPDKNSTCP